MNINHVVCVRANWFAKMTQIWYKQVLQHHITHYLFISNKDDCYNCFLICVDDTRDLLSLWEYASRISDVKQSASYDNHLALVIKVILKFTTQQNNFEYPLYHIYFFMKI